MGIAFAQNVKSSKGIKKMTCKEKLKLEYEDADYRITVDCPHIYGYAEVPDYCQEDFYDDDVCCQCWEREVKEMKKKEKNEMRKEFTKEDLETGMIVEFRDEEKAIVFRNGEELKFSCEKLYLDGRYINEDLNAKDNKENDIVKVFEMNVKKLYSLKNIDISKCTGKLLWERIEEITIEELLQMAEKRKGCKVKLVEGERNIK